MKSDDDSGEDLFMTSRPHQNTVKTPLRRVEESKTSALYNGLIDLQELDEYL